MQARGHTNFIHLDYNVNGLGPHIVVDLGAVKLGDNTKAPGANHGKIGHWDGGDGPTAWQSSPVAALGQTSIPPG